MTATLVDLILMQAEQVRLDYAIAHIENAREFLLINQIHGKMRKNYENFTC